MRQEIKPNLPKKAGPLPTTVCPTCKYEMDDAICVQDGSNDPIPGDLTVCLNCGEVLQYNDILVAKPIIDEELASLDAETLTTLSKARKIILKRGRIR